MLFWNLVWNLRGRPVARRSFRPVLEALEDRCLPSTVTSLADSGAGSLRQAIADTAPGGTVDFEAGLAGIITLTSSPLTVAEDLTIDGPGADVITVSGNHARNVFAIASQVDVQISGLTVADALGMAIDNGGTLTVTSSTLSNNSAGNGGGIFNRFVGTVTVTSCTLSGNSASQNGGGIYNQGTLTVTSCTLSGNSASGGFGGGIYNQQGTLTVTNSTLSGNSANNGDGGGIYNDRGTLTVTDSTLRGNSGGGSGGGIDNSSGTVTVTSSTLSDNTANTGGGIFNTVPGGGPGLTVTRSSLSGNTATHNGGGIYNQQAALIVTDSTLSGNSAGNEGGGIFHFVGTATLRNSIFAGNTATLSPDLSGSLNSQGHNLIGNTEGGSGFDPTDLLNVDPLLGPLQDNGGPTFTMGLLPGSPALNAGDPDQLGVPEQRGLVRAGGVNIGAYQASASAFVLSIPATVTAGTPFDVTVQAVDAFGQPALGYWGTAQFTNSDPLTVPQDLPGNYTFTSADAGQHTFTNGFTLKTAGNQSVTATDSFVSGSASVLVNPATADHLLFLEQPTDTVAGQTISPAVLVAVVDAFGNVLTSDNSDTVTLTIGTNPSNGILSGTLTVTVVNGVATFADLSIDRAGDGYTLHVTTGLTDADSIAFSITG